MRKLLLVIIVFLIGFTDVYATHNRAGEITYQYIGDVSHPFKYRVTVTTYTNTYLTQADRCDLVVYFGDGDSATAPRINGPNSLCPGSHDGIMILPNTKLNIYQVDHNYHGAGNYFITMDDANRNSAICNIPNSVDQSFTLITQLIINPFLGFNNSPTLLNPPIDDACVDQCFSHNPGAFDAEGDSLVYSLSVCYAGGTAIPGYSFPPVTPGGNISIDSKNGDLTWCSPPSICQYNIAILIKEYRLLQGSSIRYFVGSVLRDMQINVSACSNTPPVIKNINDTCIVAGTNLNFNVTATDAQINTIKLNATGGPFLLNPAATFNSTPSFSPVNGTFNWNPACSEIQLLPYLVTFKATDSNPSEPLVDFESVFIRVIAPAPSGLKAIPGGASILVDWDDITCNNTIGTNPLLGYFIYRKNTCDPWVHNPCETGVPNYTGYSLIGNTSNLVTSFTDNNNGQGLTHGIDYSYIVVAHYADGSQSYASATVCAKLVRDVPIITNVSVLKTDATNGKIWTHWVKPLESNLDTITNPPPYEYRLMKVSGFNTASNLFTQVASYLYNSYAALTDTGYVSTNLKTQDSAYTFRVDFYSNGILKGSTHTASSVFLTTSASDNKVSLSWKEFVPWTNYRYDLYRETIAGSGIFNFIDSTQTQSYVDTGLVNGVLYCYKIVSVGQYSDPVLPRPLFNNSQIKCEMPLDKTPPCQPAFAIENDCENFQNILSWTNPNTYCSNDATKYNIYFSPTLDGTMQIIQTIIDLNTTNYTHSYSEDGVFSVAGCYSVTAVDSNGNESPMVKKTCVDNCPVYELPNVFSPNGDNNNDLFTPLMPYRYIKDIDMKIYNRWGLLLFETKDPDIKWDGKNKDSKSMSSDGTYYYICTVNEIRVEGIKPRILKGFIQLINDKSSPIK